MKAEVINCLVWFANQVSQGLTYKSWSPEFKAKENEESATKMYEALAKHIDVTTLTVEEARALRFMKWEEESDLWLFPLWLVPLIPEGLVVTFIDGHTTPYIKDTLDNDIRFGCVAYGIIIKEVTE